jgi:hypothetical protein
MPERGKNGSQYVLEGPEYADMSMVARVSKVSGEQAPGEAGALNRDWLGGFLLDPSRPVVY